MQGHINCNGKLVLMRETKSLKERKCNKCGWIGITFMCEVCGESASNHLKPKIARSCAKMYKVGDEVVLLRRYIEDLTSTFGKITSIDGYHIMVKFGPDKEIELYPNEIKPRK